MYNNIQTIHIGYRIVTVIPVTYQELDNVYR